MRHIDRDDPQQVEREIDEAVSQVMSELGRDVLRKGDLGYQLVEHIEDVMPSKICDVPDFFTWLATNPANAQAKQKALLDSVIREWVIENMADIQQRLGLGKHAEAA